MLRDAGCVRDQIQQTDEGRWALDFLSRMELPFRIPTAYTTTGKQDTIEATFATVFGDHPAIRYRTDTLEAGLKAFPEFDSAKVRRAPSILKAVLRNQDRTFVDYLGADGLLVTNNHIGLHNRTDFQDRERHVLCIRIADGSEHSVKARVALQGELAA
jgi:hypothetical protein